VTSPRAADEWRWIGPDGFEYSGSKEKLCEALSGGRLVPSTPVWREGLEAWVAAESVPELAEELPPQPLPAFALESQPFAPTPEMKTPPPIGISADAVVVAAPGAGMKIVAPAPLPAAPAVQAPRAVPVRRRIWLLGLAAPALLAAAALGLWWGAGAIAEFRAKKAASTASALPVSASAAVPAAVAPPARCAATRSKQLAKTVFGRVPISLSGSLDQARLGIGFAETRTLARALLVNPESLDVEREASLTSATPIVSAAATLDQKQLGVMVDADDARLRLARTFGPERSSKIGIAPDGIAVLDRAGQLHTLWKSDARADYTVPRIESSSHAGHFVALRRGGLRGQIVGGWLAADGAARSELASVAIQSEQLGTPSAAIGKSGVLLAAAARPNEQAAWDVLLGAAPFGKVPERLTPLALRRLSESERMSPAAAALADGRWALQWTERTPGGHVVRVGLLDHKLEPLTEPVTVSPAGAESGQGELWAAGPARMLSLYLVKAGAGHGLWASIVDCH
jgi:hypothetical protein